MIVFFSDRIEGDLALLPPQETQHCIKVLRKKEGDSIRFTDGKGSWYEGEIKEIAKDKCWIKITDSKFSERIYPRIRIAIALTKNIHRFEWFVEKATELGVSEITPIICTRSERKVFKMERSQRIALSALKQSLGTYLPIIHPVTKFEEFIAYAMTGLKYIAHLQVDSLHLTKAYDGRADVNCIIGPEGDFTDSEITAALKNGFETIILGDSRLRTETAGVVAVNILKIGQELKIKH